MRMGPVVGVAVVGAGPYGLSVAAHLSALGYKPRIFGTPMETWKSFMPKGMVLKSEGFAMDLSAPGGQYRLGDYCAEQGIAYQDIGWPVPVETFAAYGEAFQRRFVPQVESARVIHIAANADGFDLELDTGERFQARNVVMATGIRPFTRMPPELSALAPELVSHSAEHGTMAEFAGRTVAVLGGGASAMDVAASLHRAGARAVVVTRRKSVRFFSPSSFRSVRDRLLAPMTSLGPGWKKYLCVKLPDLFRFLPAEWRGRILQRYLGPAPAWSVRDIIEAHVDLKLETKLRGAREADGGVLLDLSDAEGAQISVKADHVIAATGYDVDMERLAMLDSSIRGAIATGAGAPMLSGSFESSVPHLFFVGTQSATSFGPMLRFVCGADFTARRVSRRIAATEAAHLAEGGTQAGAAPDPRLAAVVAIGAALASSSGADMADAVRVLFVSLTNDVGSDRIVGELGRQGAACAVLGPKGCFASLPRVVTRRFNLPRHLGSWIGTIVLKRWLAAAVRDWGADQVVPLDELSALILRTLALDLDAPLHLRTLLIRSFGAPEGYRAACHRLPLMRAATEAGVLTPDYGVAGEQTGLRFPLVVKRDHSSGSGGVTVVHSEAELAVALRRAGLKQGFKRALARGAGFDHGAAPILVQEFVAGTLAMRTVVAQDGRVVDGVSLVAVQSNPRTRASTVLAPLVNSAMEDAAARLVAALGCSGFVSFDFILDAENRPWLLEMNPRPIGSTHLGRLFGHDLGHAFITGEARRHEGVSLNSPVGLFPKALERDPAGSLLDGDGAIHHDVPWEEPRVAAAYLDHLTRIHPAHAADLRRRLKIADEPSTVGARWPQQQLSQA